MITESDWNDAVNNESSRASFVRNIDLGDASRVVSKIFYDPIQRVDRFPSLMTRWPPTRANWGIPHGRSTIAVYPLAFSPAAHLVLDDFLSTLFDHEVEHALDPYLLQRRSEAEIMSRHIQNIFRNGRQVSESYLNRALERAWALNYLESLRH